VTFNSIEAYPDPMGQAVFLGLFWGLLVIAVVVRRSTASARLRRQLLAVAWILAVGASAMSALSLELPYQFYGVLLFTGQWLGLIGFTALAAVITYHLSQRHRVGNQ
jgi:hypothetical protein